MIKLILLFTLGVVATFAAPQAVSSTPASVAANSDYYNNNYYNRYDPYNRNYDPYNRNYDPYNRNYDGYYRNNYYGNNYYRNDPYYNRNNDAYYRNNYYKNDIYNRNSYDPYYKNNYDPYYRNNYYGNDYYNRNYNKSYYNPEYTRHYTPGAEAGARILRFESNLNPDGTYEYAYDTENGISVQEQGFPVPAPDNQYALGATGSFQYTSPEGRQIYTKYIADDNGFRAEGNAIPQSAYLRGDIPASQLAANPAVEVNKAAAQK